MTNLKVILHIYIFIYTAAWSCAADDLSLKLLESLQQLEAHVQKQEERILTLEHEVSEQTTQVKLAKEKLKLCHNNNGNGTGQATGKSERAIRAQSPHVAFSAYLDHRVHHVGIDSIIPFNQIILNDGGAYNTITGIFTVPVSGVYLFHYSVNTDVKAYQLVVKLVLDNVNMSDGTSDPFHELQEIQGGNTVIFRANQGQSVWLAAYNTGDTMVDGRPDYRFSTFSGVLLYE